LDFQDFRLVKKNITELFVLFLNEMDEYHLRFHWAMGYVLKRWRSKTVFIRFVLEGEIVLMLDSLGIKWCIAEKGEISVRTKKHLRISLL
jgi:hypothetical protein